MRRIVTGLLLVVLGLALGDGFSGNILAADPSKGPPASETGTSARIIFSDRAAKAITVDVGGTIYLYWLKPDIKITMGGKDAGIADLAPGQMVNLTLKRAPNGDVINVVEITIHSSDTASGTGARAGKATAVDKPTTGDKPVLGGKGENPSDKVPGLPPIFGAPAISRPIVSPYY